MKSQVRCKQNQPFKAKLIATFVLFFAVAIVLSSITFAEEQKNEQKSSCPYMKATSGCCSTEKSCAEKKDASKECCKSTGDLKSGKAACDSKPSGDGKSCEKKNVSSNAQCGDCKCCSACNCTGQKQAKTACSCGDNCKCCASCCINKA
ncbi:MAG TPA: hypothetical protein PLA12_08220 [Candidatus Hydrogenedens sp.]|nr:hypothetical protein [Candidatus Hydrogenedens sp.]